MRHTRTSVFLGLATGIFLAIALSAMPSCGSGAETRDRIEKAIVEGEETVEQLTVLAQSISAGVAQTEAQLDDLPEGSFRDQLEETLAASREALDAVLAQREHVQSLLDDTRASLENIDPNASGLEVGLGAAAAAVNAAGDIPSPISGWLKLGAAGIGGVLTLVQTFRVGKKKKQVAETITERDTANKFATDAHGAMLKMRTIGEDLVHSVEAARSTPEGEAAFTEHLLPVMAKAQLGETQSFVKSVKAKLPEVKIPSTKVSIEGRVPTAATSPGSPE